MDKKEYCESGDYLPDFLKDFHDQKDLFKTIFDLWGEEIEKSCHGLNWVDAHVFVIDYFTWFLGLHGYKIQKSRSACENFLDLQSSIKSMREKRRESFSNMIVSIQKDGNNANN